MPKKSKTLCVDDLRHAEYYGIARAIRENNARLVIIDPVQAFLGADVDMNRANEVRPIFRSLGDIAQATGCAIVLIGHLNKAAGTQPTPPLARLSESRLARPPISSVSISARPPRRRWRTKSSVCSVKKSAKCDFFLNLMKKSLTFRLWQNRKIDFDFLWSQTCPILHRRAS